MEVNNTTSRQEHQWFIMRQRASDTVNPEIKKNNNIYVLPDLLGFLLQMPKGEYYDYAQADFDFGQVHVIWWLSYCQVGAKTSVEPCERIHKMIPESPCISCDHSVFVHYWMCAMGSYISQVQVLMRSWQPPMKYVSIDFLSALLVGFFASM